MKRLGLLVFTGMTIMGCGGGGANVNQSANGDLTGTMDSHGTLISFTAVARDGFYDITVALNGLQLGALVDPSLKVTEADGSATNGQDTQMSAADRKVLVDFAHTLEAQLDRTNKAGDLLIRMANLWSEHPDTVDLKRRVVGDQSHSNPVCQYFQQWVYGTHDGPWLVGCDYNDWDANSTSIVDLGYRWDNSNTYYWVNGGWTRSTQDHQPYVYEAGDCFGHCGAGCPSGDQTLSWNCTDHDQCVRNGHSIAAISCDDEFTAAAADYIFANDCPGT